MEGDAVHEPGGAERAAKVTRRRGAALEHAILQTAADEIAEAGFANFTMDGVAARARTSKNAIYRRWPSRAALAVAAYRHMLPADPVNTPDTGDLRSDALALLRRANERLSTSTMLRELLSGIREDPQLIGEIRDQVSRASFAPWLTILTRAAARGEVDAESLTPRVVTVAADLFRNEYTLYGPAKIPDRVLAEIVDQVYLPLVKV